jgi:hypothetical protein
LSGGSVVKRGRHKDTYGHEDTGPLLVMKLERKFCDILIEVHNSLASLIKRRIHGDQAADNIIL